jgi:predicted SprT family Zn-dependent metalloprotease
MSSKKIKGIQKLIQTFRRIQRRLPSTYPHAALVIHMNEHELTRYYYDCMYGDDPTENFPARHPYAFCDGDAMTVHMHANMYKETQRQLSWYMLHELGHLYALQRYGEKDPRWKTASVAEPYANRFAYRWTRRLSEEGWFS